MHSILIIDDEKVQANILGDILTREGFDVTTLTDPEKALALVHQQSFDLVVSDLKMPKMDGIELLKHLRRIDPDLTVVIMTAYGTIETAVRAMREGAYDYVTKPFSKDEILITVQRSIKNLEILRENLYLKEELGLHHSSIPLIGKSQVMREIYQMVSRVAEDDKATILIQGETGTGKDVIAQAIHQMSPRREAPFIVVNCAAVPEGLMESEFFGHEKGAFTGATSAKPGRFELADRGTLFLDEVGEMDTNIQRKILRVLQSRDFERVGGTRTHHVNVRIVTATNKNLQEEVRGARFREDLFYRLNVVPIHLPPLRERKEDIPLLVEYFLKKMHSEGKRKAEVTPEGMKALTDYHYPGNIRELENILERALILSEGKLITPRELRIYSSPIQPSEVSPTMVIPLQGSLKEVSRQASEEAERISILAALKSNKWNRVKTAKELGIDYKTLRMKIQRFGLSSSQSS